MKRTRRVEIIRYTRRVTVIRGSDAHADADESPAIDITPGAREVAPPAPDEGDGRPSAGDGIEPQVPPQRPPLMLRDLLRLRR